MCLLGTDDYECVVNCLKRAKTDLADTLCAIEYLDYESFEMSRGYLNVKNPFENNHKFYLLIEVGGN